MSAEQEVEEIKSAIDQFEKERETFEERGFELRAKLNDAQRRYMSETKLLSRIKWLLYTGYTDDSLTLRAFSSSDPEARKFEEFANKGWHYAYQTGDELGTEIRADDGQLTIKFDDPKNLAKFVRLYDIKLDLVQLKERQADLETKLLAVDETIALLENK